VTGPVHVTVWGGGRTPAPRAVLVHGTMTWGTDQYGFAAQRPLAEMAELWVVDRRGFGASTDVGESDYELDAADIAGLMEGGAHLVGHSYGGVVAMLAAARRPADVRSLALIEPAAHRAAAGDAVVAAALVRMRAAIAQAPAVTPQEWLRGSTEAVGMPPLDPTPARLRAAATAMRERPCWEADVPLDALAAGPYPKLVICGTWETAPAAYREAAGEALIACAAVVAREIGADVLRVEGASHWPHAERPEAVNAALQRLWRRAAG
jgi:pimeloyl-ACP methyl ester carboxylesterase